MAVLDDFADVNGTALASHTPSGGGTWTHHPSTSGTTDIQGNRARPSHATNEDWHYHSQSVDLAAGDVVSGDVPYLSSVAGAYAGIFAGVTGAWTGYMLYLASGTSVFLAKRVAGVLTPLTNYSFGALTPGQTYALVIKRDGNDVVGYVDGVERVRVTDTSITPTNGGVMGRLAGTTSGYHVDNFAVGKPPGMPTVSASGSLLGVDCGADVHGRAIFQSADGTGDPSSSVSVIERSNDGGSTWEDITAHCTTDQSGASWLVADNRPDLGTKVIAAGGTGRYRVKVTNAYGTSAYSNEVSIAGIGIDKDGARARWGQGIYDYLSNATYRTAESKKAYPGMYISALSYLFASGFTPSSGDYLTLLSDLWDDVKTYSINGDYLHTPPDYAGTTGIRRDFHFRLVMHLMLAARNLRKSLDAGAITIADELVSYANLMARGAFDHLATGLTSNARLSTIVGGTDGFSLIEIWSADDPVAAGEVRRGTSGFTYCYRALNAGTTGSSEPTWVTSTKGHTTDNDITWEEMSMIPSIFSATYDDTTYAQTGGWLWDGNQISEIATALLLLRADDGTDFYPGGSYATAGYDHAVAQLEWCAMFQYTDGAVPVGGGFNTRDTHYGSYQLHTTAIALALLGSGVIPTADLWLDRAVDWLDTSYSTEPTITNAGVGGYATNKFAAEMAWREAGFLIAGVAWTLDLLYRACFTISTTYFLYTQYGWSPTNTGVSPYFLSYPYLFEADSDYLAVLGELNLGGGGQRLLLGVG